MTRISYPTYCKEIFDIVPYKGENCGCSDDRPPLRNLGFCQCCGINSINVGSAKCVVKDLNANSLVTSLRPGCCINSVLNEIPQKQVLEIKPKFKCFARLQPEPSRSVQLD